MTCMHSLPCDETQFDPPLDAGIAPFVIALRQAGVDTFESCQGGDGHGCPEPVVRFHGDRDEGMRAVAAAMAARLPVGELRRTWPVVRDELTGPWWELTFSHTMSPSGDLQVFYQPQR